MNELRNIAVAYSVHETTFATDAQMKNFYQVLSLRNCKESFLYYRKESAIIYLCKRI